MYLIYVIDLKSDYASGFFTFKRCQIKHACVCVYKAQDHQEGTQNYVLKLVRVAAMSAEMNSFTQNTVSEVCSRTD